MRDKSSRAWLPILDGGARCWACSVLLWPLSTRDRQHGHDFDRIARKYGEMRMLVKEPGGRLMRLCAYYRESTDGIADIVDPMLRDLLGLPKWSAHADNGRVMFLDPRLPGRHAFSFLRTALAFG